MEESLILNKLSQIAKDISGTDAALELDTDIATTCDMSSFQMAMFYCAVEDHFDVAVENFYLCRNTTTLIDVIQKGGSA